MHRTLRRARTLGVRPLASAPDRPRFGPQFWLRLALVCYLLPVILLVFAVGGIAIAAGHLMRLAREVVDSLSRKAPRPRDLAIVPAVAQRAGPPRGPDLGGEPRGLR